MPTNFNISDAAYFSSNTEQIIHYGRLSSDPIGSISDLYLKNKISIDFSAIKIFIDSIKQSGKQFFYLADAVCLSNAEISRKTHFAIIAHFEKLIAAGTSGIIVSSPMIMQIFKKHFPDIPAIISPFLKIETYHGIDSIKSYGADGVIFSFTVGRDRQFLEVADREFSGEYDFIYANSGCYIKSIFCVRHLAEMSHFSQNFVDGNLNSFDLGGFFCGKHKIEKPQRYCSSAFLTPRKLREFHEKYPRLNAYFTDANGTFDSVRHVFDAYFRDKKIDNIFSVVKNHFTLGGTEFKNITLAPQNADIMIDDNVAAHSLCAYLECSSCGKCKNYYEKYVTCGENDRLALLKELNEIETGCSF